MGDVEVMLIDCQIREETRSFGAIFHCRLLLFWSCDSKRYSNRFDHQVLRGVIWLGSSHEHWWGAWRYLVSFTERDSHCWIFICCYWWPYSWVSRSASSIPFRILISMQTYRRRCHRLKLSKVEVDRICMLPRSSAFLISNRCLRSQGL